MCQGGCQHRASWLMKDPKSSSRLEGSSEVPLVGLAVCMECQIDSAPLVSTR